MPVAFDEIVRWDARRLDGALAKPDTRHLDQTVLTAQDQTPDTPRPKKISKNVPTRRVTRHETRHLTRRSKRTVAGMTLRQGALGPDVEPLLDVDGVAARLNISVRHVRRLVAERRIPYLKLGNLLLADTLVGDGDDSFGGDVVGAR